MGCPSVAIFDGAMSASGEAGGFAGEDDTGPASVGAGTASVAGGKIGSGAAAWGCRDRGFAAGCGRCDACCVSCCCVGCGRIAWRCCCCLARCRTFRDRHVGLCGRWRLGFRRRVHPGLGRRRSVTAGPVADVGSAGAIFVACSAGAGIAGTLAAGMSAGGFCSAAGGSTRSIASTARGFGLLGEIGLGGGVPGRVAGELLVGRAQQRGGAQPEDQYRHRKYDRGEQKTEAGQHGKARFRLRLGFCEGL